MCTSWKEMSDQSQHLDPAAVLGAAVSLWHAVEEQAATTPRLSLSECYNGRDEFMRQVMRIATEFELWSCKHVLFEELDDVWPYLLEDRFGEAAVAVLGGPDSLLDFDAGSCLRVANRLRLPVRTDAGLPVAVNVTAENPAAGAAFGSFRIQTVRRSLFDDRVEAFTVDDDPFDNEWSPPYLSLFGVEVDDLLEHIADRATYSAAVKLARKLAPGIVFDPRPILPRW